LSILPRINFCGVLTVLCSEISHCAKRQNVVRNNKTPYHMEENDKIKKDELLQKLIDIQNKEKELRQRRILLQKQQPWYQQPQNIIGLLAILVTVLLTFYTIFKTTDKLQLTCVYTDPKPLTNFSPTLQEKISVTYKDIQTSNIGKITIKLINTGTKALTKDDFVDGPIEFKIIGGNHISKNDSIKPLPFLLDVVVINNSKQRNDILKLKSTDNNANFSYLPSLVNKNDIVEFDVYVSDINNVKFSADAIITNGEFISEKLSEQIEQSKFLQAGKFIIDIFGNKWIASLVILLIFLLSLLKSLFIITDDFDKSFPALAFATMFIFVDLLFVVLIVSILMN